MTDLIPRPHATAPAVLSRRRKMAAIAVAGASDLARVVFAPAFAEGAGSPLDIALDAVTAAIILFLVGFRWRLAIALVAELVPGVALFPTWTAVVLSLPLRSAPEPAPQGAPEKAPEKV